MAVRIYVCPAARIRFGNAVCVTELYRGHTRLGCGDVHFITTEKLEDAATMYV